MGVHGLWELLAPVGRRVSVETLAGKKLAIDASIWMIQFMKAMRDEKGEMIRNAHILGFFRRICKLLFLRTKPVFVFDGGTPALKRRTVIARRRQRENAQSKIRKTAEKLLLNHLKAIRLKELAEDLEKQRKENDVKGKKPIIEEPNNVQQTEKGYEDVGIDYNQEELDAMLAASLAAEEEGFTVDASTSGAAEATNDEVFVEDDEDEEMILPEMHGKVDPAVLAALPPSMQLDLLVQMRERLMAENRQKYQKVKKAPERFSELQIQSYLKTVAFRREIDGVQKAAAGRGIGGMQTSRIASEANREFIFSSSFTGDKQAFTSVGLEKVQAEQSQPPPVSEVLFTKKSSSAAGSAVAEAEKQFHDDVETYMDERGRVRVSRVRALGIRMTRDLQRNLDLMKEIDQEKVEKNQEKDNESTIQHGEITDKGSNGMNDEVVNGTSIEISFDDTLENEEDELFASLVAGDNYAMEKAKQSSHSESDCEWEEGVIEDRSTPNVFEGDINDEREVEWEEGFQNSQLKSSICPDESMKAVRKGNLEEEADFQEAIRRSLEVIEDKNTSNTFEKGINDEREVEWEEEFQDIQMKSSTCPDESAKTVRKGNMEEEADFQEAIRRSLEVIEDKNTSNTFEKGINDEREVEWEEGIQDIQMNSVCPDESMTTGGKGNLEEEADFQEGIRRSIEENDFHEDQVSEIDKEMVKDDADLVPVDEEKEGPESNFSEAKSETFVESKPDNSNLGDNHSCYAEVGKISANDFTTNVDSAKELAEEETFSNPTENEEVTINSSINYDNIEQDMMKDYLEEEMLNLGKEREELGSEQRKQERNAESVSSEMFAECQELLQMFGLPYIIAPMEAEAQCAFMELSNLVDGVVTDDSDAFLFGARSVFKNIFDDRKYVETYLMKDIEDELGLDREKLIHMAMLLGSDYTEGISGIGIVNAIEVVNAFPEKDGLREFREWIESPDPSILGVHPKKKGSNGSENLPVDDVKRIKEIFMDKHRNVSKNWHIPSTFPSDAVISAYASPQVDKSTEPFGWGKPDLFVLRKLCWEKFGWNTSKTDELLVPVLKEYNKHETQLRLEAFYTFNERFAKVRSKRINKALKGITGQKSSEKTPRNSESGKKRKVKASQDEVNLSGVDSTAGNSIQNSNTKKQKTSKRNVEKSVKNRGRGRGQVSAKGRKKKESSSEDSKSDEEMETVRSQETCRVRRSDRVRKTVNYNVSEEFENCDKEIENSLKEVETTTEVSFDQPAGGHYNLDENELNKSIPSMDTTSPSEIDGSKIEDHADLSNDYLQFGGGFCVDEDEEGKEGDKLQPSPTREKIPDESVDLNRTDIDRMSGISPKPLNGGDFPDMELSMNLDDTEDNDAPKSYLRAMPNLRRKRRKN